MFLGAIGVILALAPMANAATAFPLDHSFGSFTAPSPGSLTLDSAGNVYVLNLVDNTVERLDQNGNPINFSALGSPPGSTNVINGSDDGIDDPDATPRNDLRLLGISPATQIAVDNSGGPRDGWIYVTEGERGFVRIFDSTGAYRGQHSRIKAKPTKGLFPCGVAVDDTGAYYIAEENFFVGNHVDKYLPTGTDPSQDTFVGQLQGVEGCNLALDNDHNVYVAGPGVQYYGPEEFSIEPGDQAVGTVIDTSTFEVTITSVAVDPVTKHIFSNHGDQIFQLDANGNSLGPPFGSGLLAPGYPEFVPHYPEGIAVYGDSVYVSGYLGGPRIHVFGPPLVVPDAITLPAEVGHTTATLNGHVDPLSGAPIADCRFEYGRNSFETSVPCSPGPPFSSPANVSAELSGLTKEASYRYRVVAGNSNGEQVGETRFFVPRNVLGTSTDPASDIQQNSATLNGSFDPNGDETFYYFDWGLTTSYGNRTAVPPGPSAGSGFGTVSVSAPITGLQPGATYHYRIVARNSLGVSRGLDATFIASKAPSIEDVFTTEVKSDGSTLNAIVNPNGADTAYYFEYGTTDAYGEVRPTIPAKIGNSLTGEQVTVPISGLETGVTYHYRIVTENARGETASDDRTFTTFPLVPEIVDPCPNALARQQTGAALLLDCRAYELVSASDTNGYNVESDLVPDQTPFAGYPLATEPSRVLYAVHSGAISGNWNPTNFGPDPYLATRGSNGWTTSYVGLDGAGTPSSSRFSSVLGEASSALDAFAFAGENLCSPCFADGKTGLPVRLSDGAVVQGMAGSLDPGPGATADVMVRKRFSVDGSILVFGSTAQFESDAVDGQPTIYLRDLESAQTRVVSKLPGGANIPCLSACATKGVAGLDLSADGSRVLVGQFMGTDVSGNDLFHPYMNVLGTSIDLAPETTSGVSYAGMTFDGSRVFFTSADQLTEDDADSSVDLFMSDVSSASATLTKLSPSNSDACSPVPNSGGPHWNTVGPDADCSIAAIGGGGGVASSDGTAYFFSPELLDGAGGTSGQPNLYVVRPGAGPTFVATLEPDNDAVLGAVENADELRTADFQVTPNGNASAFSSAFSLSGYDSGGFSEIYRYDAQTDELTCASCAPTGARSTSDATLASQGRSITNDGRIFFTTSSQLVLRDANHRSDAYESSGNTIELISSGFAPSDSGILSVSADGTDAYFFTRDTLVSTDGNGVLMKIYDAREGGGFHLVPEPPPCAASDECHGPGTVVAPPPEIGTFKGTGGNAKSRKKCAKTKVSKRGRCVNRAKKQPRSKRKR